jgi:aspartyl-tRNA(Asn)/glutamyl-tRNA(Gln) amidotransferase subunit B
MVDDKYKVDGYFPTIGIECHVQFKTATKLFAAVGNDARDADPNTLISHICLGLPGALPVLNEKAIEYGVKAAFALGTEPQVFSKFDRKHYFYPDLPMGYQITQYDQPIIVGGHVEAVVDGEIKTFEITRAHIEADAGKSTHPAGGDYSLVDLNRAGTPLLEIVSEPCMHTSAEAKAYAHELYVLMKYADVSDANLFYGNMRFDVNVSVSKDPNSFGTRTETKNLNSFRAVERAVDFEIKRQIEALENGEKVVQETRGWDDDKMETFSQRTKEDAHDYRYFPDPDLPPVVLDSTYVEKLRESMPVMPAELRLRFKSAGLDERQIETIIDEPAAGSLLNYIYEAHGAAAVKTIGNWMGGALTKAVTDGVCSWQDITESGPQLVKLASMVDGSMLSSSAAKDVLLEMVTSKEDPEKNSH